MPPPHAVDFVTEFSGSVFSNAVANGDDSGMADAEPLPNLAQPLMPAARQIDFEVAFRWLPRLPLTSFRRSLLTCFCHLHGGHSLSRLLRLSFAFRSR